MSDEPKQLPARRPGLPGAPGAAAKGPRPAGASPRPPAGPPPVSAASLALRKRLLLGIVITCVALIGAIAWKLFRPRGPDRITIDVKADFDKLKDASKDTSKAIFETQRKTWMKGEELKAEDFAVIKTRLGELREQHDKMKDLLDLIHARHLDDSADKAEIVPWWLQMKAWILDATDLLDNQKPPEYGGINIPMYVTADKIRKIKLELGEINTTSKTIAERNDPAEIKAVRKKIVDMREAFRTHVKKLEDLDEYVKNGLTRPDLSPKEVVELEQLREEANQGRMAMVAAGKLLQAFPE